MPSALQPRSPLADFFATQRPSPSTAKPGVHLQEIPFLGHLNLRGNPNTPEFLAAAQSALGVALPLKANTVAETGDATIFWFGPDEWLIQTSAENRTPVFRKLTDALRGLFFSLTDISHGQTVIRISGPHAADVLHKGCTLDLHPSVFFAGRCAQSHLAKANVLLRPLASGPSLETTVGPAFEITVRSSFADYLALWLSDAASEYTASFG